MAGFGAKDSSGNFYFKALGDGEIKLGNTSDDIIHVTGSLSVKGDATFNEDSEDKDFRVESNHQTHMFFIDGSSNRIGIGTASPQMTIDIQERTGVEACIRLKGSGDVGIRLAADSDDSGEGDNPYIDFYQDAQNSNSRANRLATMGMEGDAGATFTDSLGNTFFMDAAHPNTIGASSLRTLQLANDSEHNGHKARITLEGSYGYVGIWTSTPSHALEVNGQFKTTEEAIFGTTSTDLGNGQTSTLTPASSVHLLDATSIAMNAAVGAHVMTLADGTTAGQILKIILNTTTNNVLIAVSTTNILGSYSGIAFENNKQGAAFEFVWTGSKWAMIGKNPLATAG